MCIRLKNAGKYCDITINAECVRKLRTDFERREAPSAPYVRYLLKKVKETGIVIYKLKHEKPKTVHTFENIAAVIESVLKAPVTSFQRRLQQLNISETNFALYDAIQSPFGSGVKAN